MSEKKMVSFLRAEAISTLALAGEDRRVDLRREIFRELVRERLERLVFLGHQSVRELGLAVRLAQLRLGALDLGDVGVDGDGAAFRGLPLVDLDPAVVGAALHVRLARVAVTGQPLGDPLLLLPTASSTRPRLVAVRMSVLVWRPARGDAHAGIQQLAIGAVADDQPVLGVVERKALRDGFDRVGQALLALAEGDLGLVAGGDVAPGADHLDRLAVLVADQVLLVVDPAIGAVLAPEPVLDRVATLLEQLHGGARRPARSSGCTRLRQKSGFSRYSSGS